MGKTGLMGETCVYKIGMKCNIVSIIFLVLYTEKYNNNNADV